MGRSLKALGIRGPMITIKIAPGLIDEGQYDIEFELNGREMTLGDLIVQLKINKVHTGGILINGVPKRLDEKVKDGSHIYILPLLGGG